jgi:hypothetical protein
MDEVPWYVSLIVSWLPFLVLIGTGIWVAREIRAGSHTKDGRSLAQVLDDHARELRRSNDLFEEAIKSQQRRLEALEQKSRAVSQKREPNTEQDGKTARDMLNTRRRHFSGKCSDGPARSLCRCVL